MIIDAISKIIGILLGLIVYDTFIKDRLEKFFNKVFNKEGK